MSISWNQVVVNWKFIAWNQININWNIISKNNQIQDNVNEVIIQTLNWIFIVDFNLKKVFKDKKEIKKIWEEIIKYKDWKIEIIFQDQKIIIDEFFIQVKFMKKNLTKN